MAAYHIRLPLFAHEAKLYGPDGQTNLLAMIQRTVAAFSSHSPFEEIIPVIHSVSDFEQYMLVVYVQRYPPKDRYMDKKRPYSGVLAPATASIHAASK